MMTKNSDESLHDLLNEMRDLLIVAGVPKGQIQIREGKPQIATLSKAFDWLHDFKMSLEFEDLIKVWKLLPESTWGRYKLFQIEGLVEQELLERASKRVLKKWKSKRPVIFNKDRKRKEKE